MVGLTGDVLVQFEQEQSWTARAKIAEGVATQFVEGRLLPAEVQIAIELFRLALYDAEPLVRRVLAESLKHARRLPRDIVLKIAQDLPEVSAPFLAASPLLGDEPLQLGNPRFGRTAA